MRDDFPTLLLPKKATCKRLSTVKVWDGREGERRDEEERNGGRGRVRARKGGRGGWEGGREECRSGRVTDCLLTGTQYCIHNYALLVVTKHLPLVLPQG